MPSLALGGEILEKLKNQDIEKFWTAVFQRLKKGPDNNSITLGLGEHDLFFDIGKNGFFQPERNLATCLRFKRQADAIFDERLERLNVGDTEFDDELESTGQEIRDWYSQWVKSSFQSPRIKKIRNRILGERKLGVWKCIHEYVDDNSNEHEWLTGDRSVLIESKKKLPTFRELVVAKVTKKVRRNPKRSTPKKKK